MYVINILINSHVSQIIVNQTLKKVNTETLSNKVPSWWESLWYFCSQVPRETHRNLIVPISSTSHLKTKLVKRFIKFYNSIEKCDKPHLKYLLEKQKNDVRSVFGRNVMNICSEAGTDRISLVNLDNIEYVPLPIEEHWRIPLLKDLLEARTGRTFVDLTRREINSIICLVTTSWAVVIVVGCSRLHHISLPNSLCLTCPTEFLFFTYCTVYPFSLLIFIVYALWC